MGGPRRPRGDEVQRRMAAWADEWRAAAGSDEPADRPRAEAAIASLYEASGREQPEVIWVPSPRAGLIAWSFASRTRHRVISPFARGDVGNGANREFNGLANPFGLEPAWVRRLAEHVMGQVPEHLRRTNVDPVPAAARALGLAGTGRGLLTLRTALLGSEQRVRAQPAEVASVETAAGVLGPAWPMLAQSFGPKLARELFSTALCNLAHELLDDPQRRQAALQAMQPGQWDDVTPAIAASRDVFGGFLWRPLDGRAGREAAIEGRLELARSAGPWWVFQHLAIVSERPLRNRTDDQGRPHSADGPALAWADGFEVWAWHGVMVDRSVILDPGEITVEMVDKEANIERRRVLIERLGVERLVREGGASLVHEDETGRLWRREVDTRGAPWRPRDEPVVLVEVVNATPEPDGSRRTYFLRVPPATRTARDGVAWTFGLGAVEYRPEVEA